MNQGDPNDLFAQVQGEALSDMTTPSTRMWDGSDSGFYAADISAPDEKMTFRVILDTRRSSAHDHEAWSSCGSKYGGWGAN